MDNLFLYQILDSNRVGGHIKEIPEYIPRGLSDRIDLREYQIQAFENTITYFENEKLRKNKQVHLLYHMATGSGKTVMMAGLILYLYKQGYRKFLFFVNQTNILEKTKENFLNPISNKYLFSDIIELDGNQVAIKEVENFSLVDENAINICFMTTQKLHMDLTTPKENSITIEDFEDDKIVLISDESHHVNSWTKKPNKSEEEVINSWEYSVNRVFYGNRENVLLEFTATCDLKDPNVNAKYKDKIVFDYPLAKFRESGYTKDFQNMQTDYGMWERTLIALMLSEYRMNLFADIGQNIKPVILLKSQRIADSESFYEEFFILLERLTADKILKLKTRNNRLLDRAIEYFIEKDSTLQSLVQSLKFSFAEENSIIMNGSTDNTVEKQLAVNSLEDKDNPYRIIFTVDMLNEGWDVLNLFDIVRLYETRQGSGRAGKIGAYTIKEAQLIGRGARYCPFIEKEGQEKFRRKYDYDTTDEKRILETLLYHSVDDSRYITELRQALRETGLLPNEAVEVEYKLKDSFKEEEIYKTGLIFANRRVEKSRSEVRGVDKKIRDSVITIKVSSGRSKLYDLFEDKEESQKGKKIIPHRIKLKDVDINVLYSAILNFDSLRFNVLKSHFPNLTSTKEFLLSDEYIGSITLIIESTEEKLSAKNYYKATLKAHSMVAGYVSSIKAEYEGTRKFDAKRIHKTIKDKTIYITDPHGDGVGISQKLVNEDLAIDLEADENEWYVFTDNYGTSEEKAFIKYFASEVLDLKKKYEKVFLFRNERFPELAIYDFDTGERFEPDFVLLLQKKYEDGYEQHQVFIEPKGDGYIDTDIWKERLLLRLEEEAIPVIKYADNNKYRIFGVPFFNQNHRMAEYEEAMKKFK